MMKTNVMSVDASLLLVMKSSTFDLLTDYFAFSRLSFDIYAATRQSLASVGDSPEGPLKQPGESCLKPAKKQNNTSLT
jgi:hypothetical protein